MYGGVPEKFPKLRIRVSGMRRRLGSYWMDRMDEEWEKDNPKRPCSRPTERIHDPRQLVLRRRTRRDHFALRHRSSGEKVILFASDYPHWDGKLPYMVSTLKERKDIPKALNRKFSARTPFGSTAGIGDKM